MYITQLPPELFDHILCLLHPSEIARFREVCKYTQDIIGSSVILQLHMEAALDGYLLDYDPQSRTALVASHLIEVVRARRRALDDLSPFSLRNVYQENVYDYAYERCDGFWGRTGDKYGAFYLSLHYDLLVPLDSQTQSLTKSHRLDFPVRDFICWPAGDLQVLIEARDDWATRRFHFRTFSNNEPHPSARIPFLELKKEDCSVWFGQNSLIEEHLFGIVHYESPWRGPSSNGEVMVWDWVEGKLVLPLTYALDAAFLSRECLLTLTNVGGELALALTSLSTGQSTHLLKLCQDSDLCGARFLRRSSYNTTLRDFGRQPQSYAQLCSTFPVTPDPAVDITAMELQFTSNPLLTGSLLVLSVNRLLKLYGQTAGINQSLIDTVYTSPLVHDWKQWSPSTARYLPPGVKKGSLTCVFGSKILARAPANAFERPSDEQPSIQSPYMHLVLLDFNPRAVIRSVNTGDLQRYKIVDQESPWSPPGCHHITCTTQPGLGFRATISRHPYTYQGVYLDGSTFICENLHSYDFFSFLPGNQDSRDGAAPEGL